MDVLSNLFEDQNKCCEAFYRQQREMQHGVTPEGKNNISPIILGNGVMESGLNLPSDQTLSVKCAANL